ncbi:MAG: N-acetylmuramoyl-L-alanine amidase [Oscillospiraceae bacterium]|nr:N-acetylmuramoyl-L-alanine amidase [Oscillospiraceae bacterium]
MTTKKGKICLDPGHDRADYNRSPVVPEYCEGQRMWDLAVLLKTELESRGLEVVLTKNCVNQAVSLNARGKTSKGCALLLSLHSDAASREAPNWVSALHQVDDHCGEMDAKSKEIGTLLCEAVAQLMGVGTRMVARESSADRDGNGYRDDYYGVLRSAHTVGTPAVILEHGFHTNESCTRWLLEEENLQRLAQVEADVIDRWLQEQTTDSFREFVRQLQKAIGAAVDGIPGPETLGKTPTLSAAKNYRHPAVKLVQQRLHDLGYTQVGKADGIAGRKFTAGVKAYQKDHGCVIDGEITAGHKTWRCLLEME